MSELQPVPFLLVQVDRDPWPVLQTMADVRHPRPWPGRAAVALSLVERGDGIFLTGDTLTLRGRHGSADFRVRGLHLLSDCLIVDRIEMG